MKKIRKTFNRMSDALRVFCMGGDGKVYENPLSYFRLCKDCPLSYMNNGTGLTCVQFSAIYPDKTADLMGLEIEEVNNENL